MPPIITDSPDSLVESIPDAETVRGAIRRCVYQTVLLRRLLHVAECRRTLTVTPRSVSGEAARHE